MTARKPALALVLALLFIGACGDDDDDGASQAQRLGVGASCNSTEDCPLVMIDNQELMLECLSFKGGYCGLTDCTVDLDCPQGSACVAHDDGNNYCFLICTDKPQCNYGRPVDAESNCSSNITFTDTQTGGIKACVPPTG